MALTAGTRIDRYTLVSELGSGGQGSVWLATDPLEGGAKRALKLVPLVLSRPSDVERVRREARALAKLEHPSVVRCHALFEDLQHELLGLSMDYVEGVTLSSVRGDPRLDEHSTRWLLRHLAEALAYVHQRGVVHRDLKLANVVLEEGFWEAPQDPRNVRLLDFGIAAVEGNDEKLTALGSVIGTPGYLAPELLDPRRFGPRASAASGDLFAFGVLGWRLLTGEHPTKLPARADVFEYAAEYRSWDEGPVPWPPDVPAGALGALLAQCLALRPSARPADAAEVAARLAALTGAVSAREPSAPPRAPGEGITGALEPGLGVGEAVTALGAAGSAPAPRGLQGALAPAAAQRGSAREAGTGALITGAAVLLVGLALVAWLALEGKGPLHGRPTPGPSATRASSVPPRLPTPTPAPTPPTPSATVSSVAPPDGEAPTAPASRRPLGCAEGAELCSEPCCLANQDCGAQGCDAHLPEELVVRLRPWKIMSGGSDLVRQDLLQEVCLRRSASTLDFQCLPISQLRGASAPAESLRLTVGELNRHGLDIELRGLDGVVHARRDAVRPEALRGEQLCRGWVIAQWRSDTLHIDEVLLLLDPDEDAPPQRCRR